MFFILFYFFAIIGVDIFAYQLPNARWANFDTSWNASLVLFQCFILADFSDVMYELMSRTSANSSVYFIVFIVISTTTVLNVFSAMLLDAFESTFDLSKIKFTRHHFRNLLRSLLPRAAAPARTGSSLEAAGLESGAVEVRRSSFRWDRDLFVEHEEEIRRKELAALQKTGLMPLRTAASSLTKQKECDAPSRRYSLTKTGRFVVLAQRAHHLGSITSDHSTMPVPSVTLSVEQATTPTSRAPLDLSVTSLEGDVVLNVVLPEASASGSSSGGEEADGGNSGDSCNGCAASDEDSLVCSSASAPARMKVVDSPPAALTVHHEADLDALAERMVRLEMSRKLAYQRAAGPTS